MPQEPANLQTCNDSYASDKSLAPWRVSSTVHKQRPTTCSIFNLQPEQERLQSPRTKQDQNQDNAKEQHQRINSRESHSSATEISRPAENQVDPGFKAESAKYPSSFSIYLPDTILKTCRQKHDKLSFSSYKSSLQTISQSGRNLQPPASILSKKSPNAPSFNKEMPPRTADASPKKVRFSKNKFVLVFDRHSQFAQIKE